MERMLVVVFDEEKKAYEASKKLTELDAEGDISVFAQAVVKKNSDGSISIEQSSAVFPMGTIAGTAIGALIGLLGDMPVTGAASGAVEGSLADMDRAGVNADFLDQVSGRLKPGKFALVADVSEEVTTAVDNQMKSLGGYVYRVSWQTVEAQEDAKQQADIQNEIDQLNKEEKAESRAEKKAEIHGKAESLKEKLHNKIEKAKLKHEERKKEAKAKIKYLEGKLANARGNAKAKLESRIDEQKKSSDAEQPAAAQPQVQQQQTQ